MYYLVSYKNKKEYPIVIFANKPMEAKRAYFPWISNLLNENIQENDVNVEYSSYHNQDVIVLSPR